jgi:alkylhydroperoxidase/carboxymuconolactone decarboxylase family protein YurZ
LRYVGLHVPLREVSKAQAFERSFQKKASAVALVTVSALIATGQVAQITYHLNRAMDNGLTREEGGELLGHLAFYAGWPNAFSAAPIVKDVIEKRSR